MKRQVLCLAAAWALGLPVLLVPTVWGATPATGTSSAEAVLTVKNEVLFTLSAEPEFHLRQARTYLQKNNLTEAAQALETVRAYVRLERARAAEPARDKLLDAIIALGKLERDSTKSTVSEDGFSKVAHLVHLALATHGQQMAQAAWAEKAWQVTGQHLYTAGLHLRQGLVWTDQTLTLEQQGLLKENAVLAKALMDGPGCGNSWAEEAAAPQIAAMGHLIGSVMPPAATP